MKWFHHDTAARHDPKIQQLAKEYGHTGLAIFWCLIEEIGYQSDTFLLKISGISPGADELFAALRKGARGEEPGRPPVAIREVPVIPVDILAKSLFTNARTLRFVIQTCVRIGLFDDTLWTRYTILYSAPFEQRADTYTRRRMRMKKTSGQEGCTNIVRTLFEECANSVDTVSYKVLPEEEREGEETRPPSVYPSGLPARRKSAPQGPTAARDVNKSPTRPSGDEFREYCGKLRQILTYWNAQHQAKFQWSPTEAELKKLFYAGRSDHKLSKCYQAMNLLGGTLSYPELVLRAVKLMLVRSTQTRIASPYAWLWTSLHGNGEANPPWAHLITREEE